MVKIFQKSCQQRIQEDNNVKFHKIRLILTCYMFISSRLYSCLANGSADEFQRGEQLFRVRAVKDPLQIGKNIAAHISHTQILKTVSAMGQQWYVCVSKRAFLPSKLPATCILCNVLS